MRKSHALTILTLPVLTVTLCFTSQAASHYTQNFNSYADGTTNFGDGTVLTSFGSASVQSGALRLSLYDEGGETSIFRIPAITGSATGWTATFTVAVSSGGLPADGFSFSWGSGISLAPDMDGSERGWGPQTDHLYFGFDTFDNGEADWGLSIGGADGIGDYLHANETGALLDAQTTTNATVSILWDPVNGATFKTTGFKTNIDVMNVPTPGFTPAESNVFAFAARIGNHSETLLIDDLDIRAVPEPGSSLCVLLGGIVATYRRARLVQIETVSHD